MKSRSVRNPLDLSEIRTRVSLFLSSKDAIKCSLVCKAWSNDFTPCIWRTVNFSQHRQFLALKPETISKHGHQIREVNFLSQLSEINTLKHSSIKNLRKLVICLSYEVGFLPNAIDLLRRNRNALIELDINLKWNAKPSPLSFDSVDSLIPNTPPYSSGLSTLTLNDLQLTRESFSVLMGGCPALNVIGLRRCKFIGVQTIDIVKNYQVRKLVAPISQVLYPNADSSYSPPSPISPPSSSSSLLSSSQSLLLHFPNLAQWDVSYSNNALDDSLAADLGLQLTSHCPHLRGISTGDLAGGVVHKLLRKSFIAVESICFRYENIKPCVILGLLLHQSTLEAVRIYSPVTVRMYDSESSGSEDRYNSEKWDSEADRVYAVSDHFTESWLIQLLPTTCPRLTVLAIPTHEMEIEIAERLPWVCKELQHLQIRIKGLNTKELISSTIKRWLYAMRRTAAEDPGVETITKNPITTPDRVVNHLLQFEKLNMLWLGYKTWTI